MPGTVLELLQDETMFKKAERSWRIKTNQSTDTDVPIHVEAKHHVTSVCGWRETAGMIFNLLTAHSYLKTHILY